MGIFVIGLRLRLIILRSVKFSNWRVQPTAKFMTWPYTRFIIPSILLTMARRLDSILPGSGLWQFIATWKPWKILHWCANARLVCLPLRKSDLRSWILGPLYG